MRTVAIINQKGGCGKTTTSINLAACLARLGQKTLLVDMDPQGHCGVGLAVPEDQIERTIYDALIEPADGKPADISQVVWQIASDFDLAPSNIRLAAFEQVFAHRNGREDRLKAALDRVRFGYQWCVIDCPPSVGLITFNALKACDQVIVPVETGYFSLHGLAKMMETLEVMRNKCGKEIDIRILPTLYDTRTKLAREVLSELRARFRHLLMESTVNFNTKLKEAASFGQPITEYDPGSRGYKDFVNLARELMGQNVAQIAPMAEEKLSRPAELVQRAKQLAQMANIQFGKSNIAPAVPAQPITPPSIPPVTSPLPNILPTPSIAEVTPATLPPLSVPFLSAISFSAPTAPVTIETPKSKPAPAAETKPLARESKPLGLDIGGRGEIHLPAELTSNFTPPMRMSNIEWPPEPELMAPTRPFPSLLIAGDSGEGYRAPLPANQFKTTSQKIEEFYGAKQIGAEVIFAVHFDHARSVLLAGDFNNWTPQSTPMSLGDRPGDFKKSIKLPPGRYKYRLVVDGQWVTDPHNRHVELNQFGELDNVVEVGAAASSRASTGFSAMAA